MDRLSSIEAFASAAETGSFAAAARTLGLSPQMVAKHVLALERRFGSRLFNRTTRRQSLTEFGVDFLAQCQRIRRDVAALETMADETLATPRGKLRVNAPVSFGATLLVPMVTAYLRRYPDVEVDLVLEDRQVDMVKDGFEVVFRIGTLADSDLIARPLRPFEVTVCASPAYLEKRGTPVTPLDLTGHECLGYARSLATAETVWRLVRDGTVHEVPIRNRLRISKAVGLVQAALDDFGIVLVARSMVEEHIRRGRLVEVLPDHKVESRPMQLLYVADQRQTPKLRTFVDAVMDTFGPSGSGRSTATIGRVLPTSG